MSSSRIFRLFRRLLRHDSCGSVAIMMAAGIIMFIGFGAAVVDIGYLYQVQRTLQTTADMAALAGAQDINCCSNNPGQAINTAISYSAVSGNKNAQPNLSVTMASGYPALHCFSSTGISCTGSDSANGIVVKQQTTVPLFFAKIFGRSSVPVSATSVAGKGGSAKPADVMLILDTTGSMNTPDTSCSVAGSTRLDCALAGFRALLSGFSTSQNRVGLLIFPGLKGSGSVQQEYDCSPTTPSQSQIAPYNFNSGPTYTIVGLSNDYQNADGSLNQSSNLVKAARGASGCSAGVTAWGGVGTYYADAITAAKNYLTSNGRTGVDKMIILLSDGDANTAVATPTGNNACHQGFVASQQAQAAGMSVVTIAYGSPTGTNTDPNPLNRSCTTDTAANTSACSTMQSMASSPSMFYSDTVGGTSACTSAAHSATDLSAIFNDIATSFVSGARLLSSNTN